MLKLLVLCLIPVLFGGSEGIFRQVCEHRKLLINCGSGFGIKIHYASYGRHDKRVCSFSGLDRDTNCYTDASLGRLRNICQDRQSCTVYASNSVFGDPCVGTEKYLDLAYSCAPLRLVRVCEGRSQAISCGPRRISILYANYGRLTGRQICPGGPIKTTNCRAPSSLARVRADCQGRSSCILYSNNGKFGDPCVGTYKYLEVRYSCY